MTSNHIPASEALIQRESGYGGSDLVRFADFEDEIRSIMRPYPDTSMMRSEAEIRRDDDITELQKEKEIALIKTEKYHFASLKANYKNHPNCEWMLGSQVSGTWCRLGDKKTVTLDDNFHDAVFFDINVIESEIYPEGVAVVVATVPNNGTRKPIQTPKATKKIKTYLNLSDMLACKGPVLDEQRFIKEKLLKPTSSGTAYKIIAYCDNHEEMPPYDEHKDARLLYISGATASANHFIKAYGLRVSPPKPERHIPPYENTSVDVGFFELPKRFSTWQMYINALKSAYRNADKQEGFGSSPENPLSSEVGKEIISKEEMIEAIRKPYEKPDPTLFESIRERREYIKEYKEESLYDEEEIEFISLDELDHESLGL